MITDTIRLACTLAAKDIRLYFRDKVGMALGFLLPITLITVFCAVFGSMGGGDGGLPKQTIRVADEDRTDASRKLVDALRRSPIAEVVLEDDGRPFTRASLVEKINKGKAALGLVIKPGFGAALETEGRAALELLRDPAKEMESRIASQALLPAIMEATGGRQARAMPLNIVRAFVGEDAFAAGDKAEIEKKSAELYDAMSKWTSGVTGSRPSSKPGAADEGGRPSFDLMGSMLGIESTPVDNQGGGQRQRMGMLAQSVAGTAVMMLLFGLAACGSTILQERDGGTLRRLLITPAPRGAILAGKFFFTFAIGMIQLLVMFAFGGIVFRIPVLRHAGALLLIGAATCAACTGFGIFIATVGRTQKQIEGISTLVILLMSSLGGSWWPLFITPKWMQIAGHFTLNAWAMDGFLGVLAYQLQVSEILLPLGVLFGVAAVLIALSVVCFNRRFASAERG